MELLPDWTKTQSGYSDSNGTESSLHVQLLLRRTPRRRPKSVFSSKDRSPRDLGRFPYCRRGDRKSTRLNSSHEWISYAVFCLNKNEYTANVHLPHSH